MAAATHGHIDNNGMYTL